jgi:hypothetical protein
MLPLAIKIPYASEQKTPPSMFCQLNAKFRFTNKARVVDGWRRVLPDGLTADSVC